MSIVVVTIELGESDLTVWMNVSVGCTLSDGLYNGIVLPEGIDDNVGTSDGTTELHEGKLLKMTIWYLCGIR